MSETTTAMDQRSLVTNDPNCAVDCLHHHRAAAADDDDADGRSLNSAKTQRRHCRTAETRQELDLISVSLNLNTGHFRVQSFVRLPNYRPYKVN